jgi:plastocyanin
MDAVVNLAFNHDFSKFAQNGEDERKAIEALGSALEPGKLLVVTSGTGMASGGPGHVRTESDPPASAAMIPRQPKETAKGAAERGVHVAIVRLSQVHDPRKQGLVPLLTQMAREKGVSAYVGDGANRWAAAPLKDVAHLYRLALERTGPGVTVYHAVQEEGVALREIAETLGKGLKVPVAILVGLFLALAPKRADSPTAPSVPTAPAPQVPPANGDTPTPGAAAGSATAVSIAADTAPPPAQGGTIVEIEVRHGRLVAGPAIIKLKQGDQVTLRVTSDGNDELHVHGYDLHLNLIAGQPAQLSFTADHSGRFEYELHHAHTDLGAFEVYPR